MNKIAIIFAAAVLFVASPFQAKASLVSNGTASEQPATQDDRTVGGTVLDEMDQPVIGATVSVIGTNIWTTTEIDGTFKLTIPQGGQF